MVYFCKPAEYVSQTAIAKQNVLRIVFCIWMTSSAGRINTHSAT